MKPLLFITIFLFLGCNPFKPAYIGESIEKYNSIYLKCKNKDDTKLLLFSQDSIQTIYFLCTKTKNDGVFFDYGKYCLGGSYYIFKKGICISIRDWNYPDKDTMRSNVQHVK